MRKQVAFFIPLICVCAIVLFSAFNSPDTLTVIHLTDAHVNGTSYMTIWREFAHSRAWENVDVVIDTGDFCDEYTSIMADASAQVPRLWVRGNHESDNNPADVLSEHGNQAYKMKGYTIILLDWSLRKNADNYYDRTAQSLNDYFWLGRELDETSGPVILGHHCPIVWPDTESVRYAMPGMTDAAKEYYEMLRQLVLSHNDKIVAVLSGHNHRNTVTLERGIVFIGTGFFQNGYRILHFSGNKVSGEYRYHEHTRPNLERGRWKLFSHHEQPPPVFFEYPLQDFVLGTDMDRTFTIEFNVE